MSRWHSANAPRLKRRERRFLKSPSTPVEEREHLCNGRELLARLPAGLPRATSAASSRRQSSNETGADAAALQELEGAPRCRAPGTAGARRVGEQRLGGLDAVGLVRADHAGRTALDPARDVQSRNRRAVHDDTARYTGITPARSSNATPGMTIPL